MILSSHRYLRSFALLATLPALAGCGGEPGHETSAVRRDSAGIEIVETSAPSWSPGEGWSLEELPSLVIGEADAGDEYTLYRVAGAIRMADGRIVIADGFHNQLRFYGQDGVFLNDVGREGKGPGEYEYIRGLARCGGDSIFGFDINWQAKVYTADGELVREMRLREPGSPLSPYHLTCAASGYFLITGWGAQTMQLNIGFYQAMAPASLLDREGQLVTDLGEFLASERVGTDRGSRPHPFGRATALALGGDAIYIGSAERLEVQMFSLAGDLTRILRGPGLDLAIRPSDLEIYKASRLADVDEADRPALERYIDGLPPLERFPAYTELRLDGEGNLWVHRFRRPGYGEELWTVFASDGAMLGDVVMPGDLEVTDIGSDYVLGVARDELGIERVRFYRLRK
jgi:hypothetical protein